MINNHIDLKSDELVFTAAQYSDIPAIMEVIGQAQDSIKQLNIDQWQNGYPDETVFKADIDKRQCYIFHIDNKIAGIIVVSFEPEESYLEICGSGWLTDNIEYAVIHRMAVAKDFIGSGLAGEMLSFAEMLCREKKVSGLRADTHRGNFPMQKLLVKNGFVYCGDVNIYMEIGDPVRMAYEKVIDIKGNRQHI